MKKVKLKHWKVEMKQCIAAFKAAPKCSHAWCLHHTTLMERVEGIRGAMQRIKHMAHHKHEDERAVRFHNFRPVTGKLGREMDAVKANRDHESQKRQQLFQVRRVAVAKYERDSQALEQKLRNMKERHEAKCKEIDEQAQAAFEQYQKLAAQFVEFDGGGNRDKLKKLERYHHKDAPGHTWGKSHAAPGTVFSFKTDLPWRN